MYTTVDVDFIQITTDHIIYMKTTYENNNERRAFVLKGYLERFKWLKWVIVPIFI